MNVCRHEGENMKRAIICMSIVFLYGGLIEARKYKDQDKEPKRNLEHQKKERDKKHTECDHEKESKHHKVEIRTGDDVSGAELTPADIEAMDQEMLDLWNNPKDRKDMKPEVRAALDARLKWLLEDEEDEDVSAQPGEIIIPTANELTVGDVQEMPKDFLQAYSKEEAQEMKPEVRKAFWQRVKATGAVIE